MRLSQRLKLKQHRNVAATWVIGHKKLLLKIGGGLAALLLVVQVLYPGDRMPLFASVDGVSMSGWSKSDAVKALDESYEKERLTILLGEINSNRDTPTLGQAGITVSNEERIDQIAYPWYLRIVPTSLLWFGVLQSEKPPKYSVKEDTTKSYIVSKIGENCVINAKDATLRLQDSKLTVVPAAPGGTCNLDDAVKAFKAARPMLNANSTVTIPVAIVAPKIGDDDAKRLMESLNKTSKDGIELKVADKTQKIEQKDVLSWLTFKTEGENLVFDIDSEKANAYLSKTATPVIAKAAGVTKVSTSDFTETSRQEGATGQTLDLGKSIAEIKAVLNDDKDQARAQVTSLAPRVEYSRTYSKTSVGISALMKFYDDDNKGDFGVSFTELGGQGLSAQHNGDRQFITASTYKLFVAFSTIKRVEAGQMKWDDGDIANGRNLSTCFDDMIVKSDNACAEALIKKIGAKDLNADIKSIGLSSTAFRSDNNVTTANDLVRYLTQLEKGTLPIKPENRDRMLGAMKRNVYRQGVPAGASGPVADKVGFLWGLLHDATIVYSPKGTYVLVVLTDGSSWANIADITRKIEALR